MIPSLEVVFQEMSAQVSILIEYTEQFRLAMIFPIFLLDPCAVVDCVPGSRCKVNRTTNEAYCTEPSCKINNGGCAKDEICQLQTVQCVTTPCPPLVVCLGPREVCSLEPEVGPCEAAFPRYFHNSTSGQCEMFIYGGCEGNANNFEILKECQRFCGEKPSLSFFSKTSN